MKSALRLLLLTGLALLLVFLAAITLPLRVLSRHLQKEVVRDEYQILINEVRVVDPEAAEYLERGAPRLTDFAHSGNLADCFTWCDTPQGHYYWYSIDRRIRGQKN